jgi:hypothetical protein
MLVAGFGGFRLSPFTFQQLQLLKARAFAAFAGRYWNKTITHPGDW